jgi:hypothetical protein
MPKATGADMRSRPRGTAWRCEARHRLEVRDGELGLGDVGDDPLGPLVEGRTFLGQRELPRRAVEQPGAETVLEPADLLAHRRGRELLGPGRGREGLGLHDPHEDLHLTQIVHGRGLYS